jgi:hypothetical protein
LLTLVGSVYKKRKANKRSYKGKEKPTKGGTKGREKSTKIKEQQGLSSFDDTIHKEIENNVMLQITSIQHVKKKNKRSQPCFPLKEVEIKKETRLTLLQNPRLCERESRRDGLKNFL